MENQEEKKKIRGITTGAFDLLTISHVHYLEWCRSQCDELIVLLDTDERIASMKGKHRPIVPLAHRAQIIQALRSVNWVSTFDSNDFLLGQLRSLQPDLVFCGGDWEAKKDKIVGYAEIADKLRFYPRTNNISTTNIEKRIIENHFNK